MENAGVMSINKAWGKHILLVGLLGLTGSASTVIGADQDDRALNCYAASLLGGLQLQKDGSQQAQFYLDESQYWHSNMGRYRSEAELSAVEAAIMDMAQNKYLHEMIDISDRCNLSRQGFSEAEIDQEMTQRVEAKQAAAYEARAQEQAQIDRQCLRAIDAGMKSATNSYMKAAEEVRVWNATGRYGTNYAHETMRQGCMTMSATWNQIANMGCSSEVVGQLRTFNNNYYIEMPVGQPLSCSR